MAKQKKPAQKRQSQKQKTITLGKAANFTLFLIVILFIGTLGFLVEKRLTHRSWVRPPKEPEKNYGIKAAIRFYGNDVKFYSKKYNVPYAYCMAVIMLESSGAREPKPRFEPHIYRKLLAVKNGRMKNFEGITQKELYWLSDKDLRKLATSWGPFQIMGYKIFHLGISSPNDLNNRNAIKYGIQWISKDYGWLLRQHRYKDAFHYHNTGHIFPKNGKPRTTSPDYVYRGLKYMQIFEALDKQKR